MDTSDFAKRMKEYEDVRKDYLTKRVPVMIRIDGKAFHTFTRGLAKPFDNILIEAMQQTMKYLCENISGCVLGYTQSDEITLLLIDYKSLAQGAWFGYVKRKVETISASMATMAFNKFYTDIVKERVRKELKGCETETDKKKVTDYYTKYARKCGKAMFDSRAWNMPEFEVINGFIWRQNDCVRNSIQSVAQANFSAKQLEHKNQKELMDMLMLKKGVNWNDYPIYLKRGTCCVKVPQTYNEGTPDEFTRSKWVIDKEIPTFTKDRDYIEKRFKNIRTVTNKIDQK